MAKSGPTSVRIVLDGVTHKGTYYVKDLTVRVLCDAGTKATPLGGAAAESIAKLLLSELVREGRS